MPYIALSPEQRRSLTLAVLSGGNKADLANHYGVSRAYVYKLERQARENARDELDFWCKVMDEIEFEGAARVFLGPRPTPNPSKDTGDAAQPVP